MNSDSLHLELLLSPSTQDEKAPSFEGASLVAVTPPIGKAPGWDTGGGVASGLYLADFGVKNVSILNHCVA